MGNSKQRRRTRRSAGPGEVKEDICFSRSMGSLTGATQQKALLAEDIKRPKWKTRLKAVVKWIGPPTTLFGLLTICWPRLNISDPVTMDANQFLSKYVVIRNDGLLPVFRTECGLFLTEIKRTSGVSIEAYGEGPEPRLSPPECTIGMVPHGDQFVFAVDSAIRADFPAGQMAAGDFGVYVSFIPIIPPLRMEKCVHFAMHKEQNGTVYWFRSPENCPMLPWFHV